MIETKNRQCKREIRNREKTLCSNNLRQLAQTLVLAAGHRGDAAFDFQLCQQGGHGVTGQAAARSQCIDIARVETQVFEKKVSVVLFPGGRFRMRRACHVEFFEYIFRALYQLRAIPDQLMTPLRERRMYRSGYSENLAPLLVRKARGDQRAALSGSLDYQAPAGKRADQAIAPWKIMRERSHAQREFRHERTLCGELVCKRAVTRGIHDIETGAVGAHA